MSPVGKEEASYVLWLKRYWHSPQTHLTQEYPVRFLSVFWEFFSAFFWPIGTTTVVCRVWIIQTPQKALTKSPQVTRVWVASFESWVTYHYSQNIWDYCSFHVKWRSVGKVSFLFFKSVLLVLTKVSFWQQAWAIGYYSMKFRHFLDIF